MRWKSFSLSIMAAERHEAGLIGSVIFRHSSGGSWWGEGSGNGRVEERA